MKAELIYKGDLVEWLNGLLETTKASLEKCKAEMPDGIAAFVEASCSDTLELVLKHVNEMPVKAEVHFIDLEDMANAKAE